MLIECLALKNFQTCTCTCACALKKTKIKISHLRCPIFDPKKNKDKKKKTQTIPFFPSNSTLPPRTNSVLFSIQHPFAPPSFLPPFPSPPKFYPSSHPSLSISASTTPPLSLPLSPALPLPPHSTAQHSTNNCISQHSITFDSNPVDLDIDRGDSADLDGEKFGWGLMVIREGGGGEWKRGRENGGGKACREWSGEEVEGEEDWGEGGEGREWRDEKDFFQEGSEDED